MMDTNANAPVVDAEFEAVKCTLTFSGFGCGASTTSSNYHNQNH
jgi:hypothetical protein